jgi:hypothetical protein
MQRELSSTLRICVRFRVGATPSLRRGPSSFAQASNLHEAHSRPLQSIVSKKLRGAFFRLTNVVRTVCSETSYSAARSRTSSSESP